MKVLRIVLAVIITTVCIYAISGLVGDNRANTPEPVFHATLADVALYDNDGLYHTSAYADAGLYELRFVPNGDSPRTLRVVINGNMTMFEEDFELFGTRQGTASAIYYTWEYLGDKDVTIVADSTLAIIIDPYGQIHGPVSVTLVPKG